MYRQINIPQRFIDTLIYKYYNDESIHTASGKLWLLDKDYCMQFSDFINVDSFVDCSNIFQIRNSYKPHTDLFMPEVRTNVIIPLIKQDPNPLKFILFDQMYKDRATWVWNSVKDISTYPPNTYQTRPYETPGVLGLTDEPAPVHLHDHLPYTLDYFHGLTGDAIDWTIGTAIAFDASQIHTSGKQQGWKVGASIRLSCTIEEAFR